MSEIKYIRGFDGLRGISIILVLLTHLGLYFYLPDNEFIRKKVWLLISGGTGVFIFFALSGFLITRILLLEKEKHAKINFSRFYYRRFLRLSPPLLIFLAIVFILMMLEQIQVSKYGVLFAFFYMYNFIPRQLYSGELSHTWSLGVEEQFYLLWPLVIAYYSRYQSVILFALAILSCVIVAYLLPEITTIKNNFTTYRWFLPAAGPIFLGAIMSWMSFDHAKYLKLYRSFTLLLLAFTLFISPLYLPTYFDRIIFIIQAIGVALFLNWIFHRQHSRIVHLLEWQPLAWLGRISYGVYIWQGLFLRTEPWGATNVYQKFPLNIILTLIVASISYYTIERWSRKMKELKFDSIF